MASDPLLHWPRLDWEKGPGCQEAMSLQVTSDWAEDIPTFLHRVQGTPSLPQPAPGTHTHSIRAPSPRKARSSPPGGCVRTHTHARAHLRWPATPEAGGCHSTLLSTPAQAPRRPQFRPDPPKRLTSHLDEEDPPGDHLALELHSLEHRELLLLLFQLGPHLGEERTERHVHLLELSVTAEF